MDELFPARLIDVVWDFTGKRAFPSRTEFESAVYEHLSDVHESAVEILPEQWQPNEIALRCPRVVIRYYCDPPDQEPSWQECELRSDDGALFSVGELFYKLHNAIIGDVHANGHPYFEGLVLSGRAAPGVPMYRLAPGS